MGKVLVEMFVGSVQIINRLDSQRKFQIFALFSGRHVGGALRQHGGRKIMGSILGSVNLRKTFRGISEIWENAETQNLEKCLLFLAPVIVKLLTLSTE